MLSLFRRKQQAPVARVGTLEIQHPWARPSSQPATSTLAGAFLVITNKGPDDDRLEYPVLLDRPGERGDLGGVEVSTRLERVRVDPVARDMDQVGLLERGGLKAPLLGAEQRVEAASESALVHGP